MADVSLLNANRYFSCFPIKKNEDVSDNDYVWEASDAELLKFGGLAGTVMVDTPLEFVLLSYYSQPIIKIRPVQADTILPANNPKLSGLKLGAALYQDIQVLRYLADNNAVGRYETMLKFVCDKNGVTRAEVEAYYRNGIRSLISDTVDEEFNKISFVIENIINQQASAYGSVLTRNPQNGQYTLSYERPSIQNSRKELSAQTPKALLAAMRNSGDFSQAAIDIVEAQAALIPAVGLSDTALGEVKTILTNFYITPNATTYNAVKEVYTLFTDTRVTTGKVIYGLALLAYVAALAGLNAGLARKVADDKNNSVTTLTRDQQQRLVELRR